MAPWWSFLWLLPYSSCPLWYCWWFSLEGEAIKRPPLRHHVKMTHPMTILAIKWRFNRKRWVSSVRNFVFEYNSTSTIYFCRPLTIEGSRKRIIKTTKLNSEDQLRISRSDRKINQKYANRRQVKPIYKSNTFKIKTKIKRKTSNMRHNSHVPYHVHNYIQRGGGNVIQYNMAKT